MAFKIVIFVALFVVLNIVSCQNVGVVEYLSIDAINTMIRGGIFQGDSFKGFNFTIPNLSGKRATIFGNSFSWGLNNLEVMMDSTPFIEITLSNSQTARIAMTGFSVKLAGTFLIMKNGKPIFRQHINGSACLEGHIKFKEEGRNVIEIPECVCTASCGGIQLNLEFNDVVPKFIQTGIENTVAEITEKYLNEWTCGYVRSLNLSKHLDDMFNGGALNDLFYMHAGLVKKIDIRNGGVIAYLSGNVIPREESFDSYGDNNMVGSTLPKITPFIQPNRSAQGLISNYTLSTFVFTAVKLGLLDKWIYANSLSPEDKTYFAINCTTRCFGTEFPQLQSHYPGKFVDMHLVVQDNVSSYITEDFTGITITIMGEFVIGNYSFLTLNADVCVDFALYIEKSTQTVKGKLLNLRIENIRILSSPIIGDIPSVGLDWIFDVLKNVELNKTTTGYLNEGINLNSLNYHRTSYHHVRYTTRDYDIKLYKDFLYVSHNVYLN